MHLTDADRLRLAVAIATLRSKPKEASVTSYVLDLRASIPPSGPTPPTTDYYWRIYALRLERDLKQLQEHYEAQKTKIASDGIPSKPQAKPDAPPADTKKKKPKAKAAPGSNDAMIMPKQHSQLDPETTFQGVCNHVGAAIPRNSEFLLSLWAFGEAVSVNRNGPALLQATLQALRAASRVLMTALDHSTASAATLTAIGRGLQHVITTSLRPIYIRQNVTTTMDLELSDVDKVFDCLIDNIFRPVIRAFKQTTQDFVASLVRELSLNGRSENHGTKIISQYPCAIDLRPDLLRLFQTLVDSLCSVASSIQGAGQITGKQDHPRSRRWAVSLSSLKASLGLEVIGELKRILFPALREGSGANGTETEPDHPRRRDSAFVRPRVLDSMVPGSANLPIHLENFLVKDAEWYLCSLMHILADLSLPNLGVMPVTDPTSTYQHPSKAVGEEEGDGMALLGVLHDAILSALYNLVLKCQQVMDQAQRGRNHHNKEANPLTKQSNGETRHPLDIIHNNGKHNPGIKPGLQQVIATERHKVKAPRVAVSLTDDDGDMTWDSQIQDLFSAVTHQEPEVGDPGGRDLHTLSDINIFDGPTGGAQCIIDAQACDSANEGRSCEVTCSGDRPLSENQADRMRPPSACLIDEVGFTMLLGVVERYILDPWYVG